MKLGLHIVDYTWPGGPSTVRQTLTDIAQIAEATGFDAIAVADHVWQSPYLGGPETAAGADYGPHETDDRRASLDGLRGPIWPRCEPRSHARSSLASPLPRLCTRRVSMVRPCKRSKG